MKFDLNELAKRVHAANIKWWQDPKTGQPIERNRFELLALAISEVCEALEGERKNLMDDHLPHRKMVEVEMADAYIRLLDFAGGFRIELFPLQFSTDRITANKGEAMFNLIYMIGQPHSLSYCLAYIEVYCVKHGYDLEGALEEKLAYNAKRADHTHAARLAAGGKRF